MTRDTRSTALGARYEISVDGTVRTCGDLREVAIDAAKVLKTRQPSSKVVIRDLWTGAGRAEQ